MASQWWRVGSAALVGMALLLVVTPLRATEKTELSVMMWINDTLQVAPTEAVLAKFERANPPTKVTLVHEVSQNYHDKLYTMIAADLAPDVAVMGADHLRSLAPKGILLSLDPFVAKDTGFDPRRDVFWSLMTTNLYAGSIYGFPMFPGPAVMMYNPQPFAEVGAPDPGDYEMRGEWTWDTLVLAGRKLTRDFNGDGTVDFYASNKQDTWAPNWQSRIYQAGGRIFSEDGTRAIVDSPAATMGIQSWLDLTFTHGIAVPPAVSGYAIENGKTAIRNVWATAAIRFAEQWSKDIGKVEIAQLPAGPAGFGASMGSSPISVLAHTKSPDMAYRLAKYVSLESTIWDIRGGIPPMIRVARSPEYRAVYGVFSRPEVVVLATETGVLNAPPIDPGVGGILNEEITAIWRGEKSATEGATEAARRMNAVLERAKGK